MTDVSTHLMFQDGSAREAVERYVELIPNSAITEVTGSDGPGQTIRFTLANRPFIAFESPVAHGFGFTPSMSIFVTCDTPDAVDELFGELSTDGSVLMPCSRRSRHTSDHCQPHHVLSRQCGRLSLRRRTDR